jgi:hypothetical protein
MLIGVKTRAFSISLGGRRIENTNEERGGVDFFKRFKVKNSNVCVSYLQYVDGTLLTRLQVHEHEYVILIKSFD